MTTSITDKLTFYRSFLRDIRYSQLSILSKLIKEIQESIYDLNDNICTPRPNINILWEQLLECDNNIRNAVSLLGLTDTDLQSTSSSGSGTQNRNRSTSTSTSTSSTTSTSLPNFFGTNNTSSFFGNPSTNSTFSSSLGPLAESILQLISPLSSSQPNSFSFEMYTNPTENYGNLEDVPVPLPLDLLEKIPLQTFSLSKTDNNSTCNITSCSICQEDIKETQNVRVLPCDTRHTFHALCIDRWFAQNNDCPHCRKNIQDLLENDKN